MALNLAKTHYPNQGRAISILKAATERGATVEQLLVQQKTAVAAGTTTDATWASPLLAYNTFAGDFVEYLRPQTILGKFGQGGVPDLRRIPFNVHIKGQTSGGTGYWVGEGKPKPVTKYDFNDTYHGFTKVAAISVLTEELIRFSDPSAERLVRDALAGTLIAKLDSDFIDPAVAASAGVSPASITNGVAAITSSGTTGDDVRADIGGLWAAGIAANLPLTSAVYITTPSIALALSLMTNALGQPEFPGFTMNGGTLLGVPTITSNHVPAGTFILAYASEIYLSDDGNVTVDASREASIQMLDNPTNASSDGTPTTMVSMFQTNSVALRAERFINWSKRRTTAVALLEDVAWGGAVPS
jgi:HK97 family phage major capsid protein